MFLTVNELIRELGKARANGQGDLPVGLVHATQNNNPSAKEAAVFPIMALNTEHGVNLIQSNYIAHYIPAVFRDSEQSRDEYHAQRNNPQ